MRRFIQAVARQSLANQRPNDCLLVSGQQQPICTAGQQHFNQLFGCHSIARSFSQTAFNRLASDGSSGEGGSTRKGGFWSSLTGGSKSSRQQAAPGSKSRAPAGPRAPLQQQKRQQQQRYNNQSHGKNTPNPDDKLKSNSCQTSKTGGQSIRSNLGDSRSKPQHKSNQQEKGKPKRASTKLSSQSKRRGESPLDMELRSAKSKASSMLHEAKQKFENMMPGTSDRNSSSENGRDTNSSDANKLRAFTSTSNYQVKHDKRGRKFVMDLGDGQVARIEYRPIQGGDKDHKSIELFHTEVPEQVRGQGLGRILARGALEQAQKANLKCKLTCSYLIDYLDKFASDEERKSVIKCD